MSPWTEGMAQFCGLVRSGSNLISIVKWIDSGTLLRDEDEGAEEAVMELGFRRHGAKIVAAINSAVGAALSDGSGPPPV